MINIVKMTRNLEQIDFESFEIGSRFLLWNGGCSGVKEPLVISLWIVSGGSWVSASRWTHQQNLQMIKV